MTDRLVTEWVRLGLLDQAIRVSRSDGRRGARYEWPDSQRDLLLTLLAKRSDVRTPSSLVILPIAVWMYWGEEWVPLRQVRRALATSVGLFGPPRSIERARGNARQVVAAIAPKDAPTSAVRDLREYLTVGMHTGRLEDERLHRMVKALIGSAGLSRGPFTLQIEELVRVLRATTVAIERLGTITDGQFVEARNRHRSALLEYSVSSHLFAGIRQHASLFAPPTIESLIEGSARDLLFNLGLLLLARDQKIVLPPLQLMDWHAPPLGLIGFRDPPPGFKVEVKIRGYVQASYH